MTSSAYVSVYIVHDFECIRVCLSVLVRVCVRLPVSVCSFYVLKEFILQYGWTASSSDWKPACKGALQAWQTTAGQLGEWNPSCRAFDVYYNELHDIDTSTPTWKATYDTDPGSVDGWLSAVGGGIY